MALASTLKSPVSLPQVLPATLPKTQAEWQQHLTTLRQWQQLLQAGQWNAPTLKNNWTNYGSDYNPAGYYADLTGRVWLRGTLLGASQTPPSVLFVLPWTPAYTQIMSGHAYNSTPAHVQAVIEADTSGNVTLLALSSGSIGTGTVSIDGLSFSLSP